MMEAEFMREAVDRAHGLFHQPLRAGNLILEAAGVDLGRLFQRQQPDIDPKQDLPDFIVKQMAGLPPFVLVRREDRTRQMPQFRLQATGLLQELGAVFAASLEGVLRLLALGDAPLQASRRGGGFLRALGQRLVQLLQAERGLPRGGMPFLERSVGLAEEGGRALEFLLFASG
jgi:hypothetical protein